MTDKTDRELAQSNIAENRKAYHDYHLLETFEAGVVLLGTEVKAIREGRVNLRDSFARIKRRDADRETRAAVKAHRR
jgi:SsrA-binding protein